MVWDGPPAQVRILTTCPRLDNEVTSWARWEPALSGWGLHTQQASRPGLGGAVAGELQGSGETDRDACSFNPTTGGLNNRNMFSYGSGSWKSSGGQRGGRLPEAPRERPSHVSRQLLGLLAVPAPACLTSRATLPATVSCAFMGILLSMCSGSLFSLLLKTCPNPL